MHLLLPIDADEDRAIAAAETVKSLPDAADSVRVTVLNVRRRLDGVGEDSRISSDEWYDEGDFPPGVARAEEILSEAGIAVERRREHANPAEAIIDVAEEIGADMIVMSGRKQTPVGKVLFGSVVQAVILDSDVPVTVVPE